MINVNLCHGDCLDVMAELEANSIDTIITDPPYGLKFMGKDWDHGVPGAPYWQAALRVARPGAMMLAFGGTRTHHRLMCAIEDAGWEIRDCLMWLYGTGFPKSHNISKAIDRISGIKIENNSVFLECTSNNDPTNSAKRYKKCTICKKLLFSPDPCVCDWRTKGPSTDLAKQWDGYGTALKPAWEPIILAMKPLDGTFAHNALTWGVGGLNIDGGRIPSNDGTRDPRKADGSKGGDTFHGQGYDDRQQEWEPGRGRWPANLILSHSPGCRQGLKIKGSTNAGHNSIRVTVIKDTEDLVSAISEPGIDVSITGFCSFSVVPLGSVNLNNGIRVGEEKVDGKRAIRTDKELLMDKRQVQSLDPVSNLQLNKRDKKQPVSVSDCAVGRELCGITFSADGLALDTAKHTSPGARDARKVRLEFRVTDGAADCSPCLCSLEAIDIGTFPRTRSPFSTSELGIGNTIDCCADGASSIVSRHYLISQDQYTTFLQSSQVVEAWECVEDGSCPVAMLDEQSGERPSGGFPARHGIKDVGVLGAFFGRATGREGDCKSTGGASRFFYCAKASRSERTNGGTIDNRHPTVKPLALMRYLVNLTRTPTGGTVFDPFMGSGSTGVAAILEGSDFVGIEKDAHSHNIAQQRISDAEREMAQRLF